jgi:DNA-directed RNA polymerase specialized sigma24 family protein
MSSNGARDGISYPVAYLRKAALNSANDLLSERGEERKGTLRLRDDLYPSRGRRKRLADTEQPIKDVWVEISQPAAIILVEELLEIEAEPEMAVRSVRLAVSRLSPALRQTVEHILVYGPDYNSADAPTDLGMAPATFRKNKERAFEALRRLIPVAYRELGAEMRTSEPAELNWQEVDRPEEEAED